MIAQIANHDCTECKLQRNTVTVCQMGHGNPKAKIMVVGKMPNGDEFQDKLEADLVEAGIDPADCYFAAALKCRNWADNASPADTKACRHYLEDEIALVKPKWILAMGNEALLSTTGHSGIMKYRGRVVDKGSHSVFPTISPASVQRNPGQRQAYVADLRLFLAGVLGTSASVDKPKRVLVADTKPKLKKLKRRLADAKLISYDIETKGRDEFDPEGVIVSLAGTLVMQDGSLSVFAVPLCHPESPWFLPWKQVVRYLGPALATIPKQVAHNGKFDARWLRRFGAWMMVTFDTMLAAHILDENRQKGLKPQAASRLGVAPWAISTKDLWSQPLRNVVWYNVLDTWYTYHIYLQLREELIARPRTRRIYQRIVLPANEIYVEAEQRGVWMDRGRIATRKAQTGEMVKMVEDQLMEWVPDLTSLWCGQGHDPADEIGWPRMGKGQKLAVVNFNPSNFSRWWLFDHLGLPILERGKEKPNGDPGDPSMKEAVLLELKGQHPAVPLLLKRTNQVKLAQFMEAYDALLDEDDRIHTTFKLAGTVTGRTSSGKVDEEKISGRAGDRRGINLQQVPRDPFVRGLFGAAPGYTFVEADFSQVELRIVAYLSRDPTMLRLYQTGQDIHRATASWVLGVPPSQVSKEDRKKAKAVNFGFVYGMGAPKFVSTAFEKYELIFTLEEAQQIRRNFFAQFAGLQAWHNQQRRLAHRHGYVESPIGRVRHLPDVHSQDDKVVGEAERQAINSPVQSFGSDMMLLALRLIKAELAKQGLASKVHVVGSVHDAGLFEVKTGALRRALPIIKDGMEGRLMETLEREFACSVDVPIVADLKVGKTWGDADEITPEQIYDWKGLAA